MGGGNQIPLHSVSRASSDPKCSTTATSDQNSHLHAVVDMGSNGIRCSISDLSAPTTRVIPTVHFHRVNISLYEAQIDPHTGNRIPIPRSIIDHVVSAIIRFQIICVEIGVPASNIRLIATEATRTALNSTAFTDTILKSTGIKVEMLRKEEEGIVGAWGIASSFSDVEGLALDLGGGSMQMTWIISHAGNVQISPRGSVSFPYGAAALTQKLADLKRGKNKEEARKAKERFREEISRNLRTAFNQIEVPDSLVQKAHEQGGFPLYLSGGGFRGWGYLLLYLHQTRGQNYPISIINGYSAPKEDFENTEALEEVARTAHEIFRVSDRRRKQVPSVAFLVNVLAESLPHGIREAHFCQGGVREGVLFRQMLPVVRQQDPLEVATARYAPSSAQAIAALMLAALPRPDAGRSVPSSLSLHLVQAFANALYVHASMAKELSSSAALYSTSTGILASTHGIPHSHRALLALMLQERYGGELPPRDVDLKSHLQGILTPEEVWWTRYLGKFGLILGQLYPTGSIDTSKPRIIPSARWVTGLGKNGKKDGLQLTIAIQKVQYDPTHLKEELERDIQKIHKVGKRKNWIGGKNGWGIKVVVSIEEEDLLSTHQVPADL
ncbi:Ppx/GppA phosphatase [Penicillium macrosclerotiorum]|uniref:Ppx/GppA phosphatase n=1 Tax=Penicillium macrosclerotiorum TaxID=303699 RepID=UPI002548D155|nr:Ppx/GppA phosphatase [Penicillium macrosclerotiorum]KAJ5666582.1 Ppx/GppA phosphatase [Penicillium macrosclerotiorum]